MYMSFKEYASRIQDKTEFRVLYDFMNSNKVHPLKQKNVYDFVNSDIVKKYCEKVIIFGSSVNISCTCRSDLDVAVKLLENNEDIMRTMNLISKELAKKVKNDFDLICLDITKGRIINEIDKKGVIVYECQDN